MIAGIAADGMAAGRLAGTTTPEKAEERVSGHASEHVFVCDLKETNR